MNKLTKEQSQWLINIFNSKNAGIACMTPTEVRETLRQCTEKEFPEYHTKNIHITKNYETIEIKGGAPNYAFTYEAFRQFASGCDKIVEYLNES